MSVPQIVLYLFIALTVVAAGGILFIRNVFHGALLLLVCLLSIAGIYVLLYAEFVAVTQILIYAGGVLVVIIFGIMLTSKIAGKALTVKNNKWFAGSLTGLILMGMLFFSLSSHIFPHNVQQQAPEANAVQTIGISLMTDYLIPFETAGILLLLALIGAAVMASETQNESVK